VRAVLAAAEHICAACILAIAFVVLYEIVARFVFDAPTTWSQEIAVYLLLALTFLGLAPTLAANEHIRIDMLARRFRPRVRRALEVVVCLSMAAFAAVAAWGGVDMVRQSLRFGRKSLTLLEVPVWIPQLLVPIGSVMLLATALWLAGRQRPPRDDVADE
jgi:TRAP-type C4-dicarboxylate transport system permease small subunit